MLLEFRLYHKYVYNKNNINMRFISYTATDTYYEFIGENGNKTIMPTTSVILVDDESNLLSIKLVNSRKVIGTVPSN